jgi:hypothetical protein
MNVLTCSATRRRLEGFLDKELSIADQIAVSAHLEWCDSCASRLAEIRSVGLLLRAVAPGGPRRGAYSHDEAARFSMSVMGRLSAERNRSMVARARLLLDDMHVVYAGLAAAAATSVCLLLIVGMMRFAADHRPDSLAGILTVMASSFECTAASEGPKAIACREHWMELFQRAKESVEQDAVFTLDAVVIREGRLANLAALRTKTRQDGWGQAQMIEELLDTVSRARSAVEPTEFSESMVRFVVNRETVRTARQRAVGLPLSPAKPRAATGTRLLLTV